MTGMYKPKVRRSVEPEIPGNIIAETATEGHKIITKVPAVISRAPITDLTVNCSWRQTAASTRVMTMLNLSTGTTLEASPICNAL